MLLDWIRSLHELGLLGLAVYFLQFMAISLTLRKVYPSDKHRKYHTIFRLRSIIQENYQAYRFLFDGASMIETLYQRSNGRPFVVPTPDKLNFMVSSQQHILELDRAPSHQLSLHAVAKEFFQPKHTMDGFEWQDQRGIESTNFVRALRNLRNTRLRDLIPKLSDVIQDQVDIEILRAKQTSGWSRVPLFSAVQQLVTRTNCAVFFPPELSSNPDFVKAALDSTQNVYLGAEIIRTLPSAIGPFVARLATRNHKATRAMYDSLYTVVQKRMQLFRSSPQEGRREEPDDGIQWVINATFERQSWTAERIVHELMATFYGSFSFLAFATTYALVDLYSHPEYIESLRIEVSGPLFNTFLASSEGLPELDAFLKESARLSAFDSTVARRQALEDFQCSDGFFVPKGSLIGIPHRHMMCDEAYFDQAARFDGRRFLKGGATGEEVEEAKLSTVSDSWLIWGTKRITCPGRFYAVVVLKLVLANMLKNYDCELEPIKGSRSSEWRGVLVPKAGITLRVKPLRKS